MTGFHFPPQRSHLTSRTPQDTVDFISLDQRALVDEMRTAGVDR